MCLVSEVIRMSTTRRGFLKGAGSVAAVPLMGGLGAGAVAAPPRRAKPRGRGANNNTRVVLLGTAGGPTWWPGSDRASTSSALIVGDAFYIIDLGHGSTHRLAEAFNEGVFVPTPGGQVQKGYPDFLRNARALFFTHLHGDHTADYPGLIICGQTVGLNPDAPLQVYGPGNRQILEPVFGGGPEPEIINPDNPTPGMVEMTDYLFQAFAQTMNDFMRDLHWKNFRHLIEVHDITLPDIPGFIDANQTPVPDMDPFPVYADDRVSVQAILVNHQPVWPSFAFRFDTDDGSVVFSGDTGPSPNLIKMAQGADVLVHEVFDGGFIDRLWDDPTDQQMGMITHLKKAHTMIEDVGGVAEEAGVGTLVLNHIGPGNTPTGRLRRAQRGFSGEMIIGEDLMQVGVDKSVRPDGVSSS